MKFITLLCWVLLLSWLTHAAASPAWRTPGVINQLLTDEQALERDAWTLSQYASWANESPSSSIQIYKKQARRWARITRDVELPENTSLLRVRATLDTKVSLFKRLSLSPPPVLHFRLNHGMHTYPLVVRPLFFRHSVVIDEVLELVGDHDVMEIALISSQNSNWNLSRLSVSAVREHVRYTGAYSALVALWGLTLFWGVLQAWRRSKLPTFIVSLTLGLVLLGVLASRTHIVSSFNYLVIWVQSLGGGISTEQFGQFMELGHLGIFTVLTVLALVFRVQWRLGFWQILSGIVVLAVATEAFQRHIIGRSPDVQDLLFDFFGILLGTFLYGLTRNYFLKLGR